MDETLTVDGTITYYSDLNEGPGGVVYVNLRGFERLLG
jgi:hypothetical protein